MRMGLEGAQALRFYARQNSKLSPFMRKKAIGLYFNSVESLPTKMRVNNWSSGYNTRAGALLNGGAIYLLNFEAVMYILRPLNFRSILDRHIYLIKVARAGRSVCEVLDDDFSAEKGSSNSDISSRN